MGYRDKVEIRTTNIATDAGNVYAVGDVIDSLKTINNAVLDDSGASFLEHLTIIDKEGFSPELQIIFFSENPTASTISQNNPLNIAAADYDKILGVMTIPGVNYIDLKPASAASAITHSDLNLVIQSTVESRVVYFCVVTQEVVTYTNADSLVVKAGISQQ